MAVRLTPAENSKVIHILKDVDFAAFLCKYSAEILIDFRKLPLAFAGVIRNPVLLSSECNFGTALSLLVSKKVDTAIILVLFYLLMIRPLYLILP